MRNGPRRTRVSWRQGSSGATWRGRATGRPPDVVYLMQAWSNRACQRGNQNGEKPISGEECDPALSAGNRRSVPYEDGCRAGLGVFRVEVRLLRPRDEALRPEGPSGPP